MKRQQASHTKQFDSKITAQSNAVSLSSTYTSKHPFLQFHQAISIRNQALSRLIQAKLRIGQAGDVDEQGVGSWGQTYDHGVKPMIYS